MNPIVSISPSEDLPENKKEKDLHILYTSTNEEDSKQLSNESLFLMPTQEFSELNHPLDILEQLYSQFYCISDFYGINDLKDEKPFESSGISPMRDKKLLIPLIRIINFTLILTLVKMILCPFSIFLDVCGCFAIRRLDTNRMIPYNVMICGALLTRIIAAIFILNNSSDFLTVFFGIWILAGAILEIPQIILICKANEIVKSFTSAEMKIVEANLFKSTFWSEISLDK